MRHMHTRTIDLRHSTCGAVARQVIHTLREREMIHGPVARQVTLRGAAAYYIDAR